MVKNFFAFLFLLIPLQVNALSMKEAKIAGDFIIPDSLQAFWKGLTLKEKIAQTIMVYMPNAAYISKYKFGGVLVMKSHFKDTTKLKTTIEKANKNLKIPLLVATDQEGGQVNRLSGVSEQFQKLPSAKKMREMQTDSLYALSLFIGEQLKNFGINLNLAPVLDPPEDSKKKPSFMEVSERSFGKQETAKEKVQAFAEGMKAFGILCTSKHFPGYDSWTNSDNQIAISTTPKGSVKKNASFFTSMEAYIPVIMMSSVRFVRYSNKPAVFDSQITNLVRENSPYAVLLTDDLWGVSLRSWISGKDRVRGKSYPAKDFKKLIRSVLLAGNDMFMITYPKKAVEMIRYMEFLGKTNPVYREKIEQAAARIIRLKYLNHIWKNADSVVKD